MDDDKEGGLRASGGIENIETDVSRAIDLLAAKRLGVLQAVKHEATGIFHGCERPSIRVARRTRIDPFRERGELSRTNDLSPAARRPRMIVEAESDHAIADC